MEAAAREHDQRVVRRLDHDRDADRGELTVVAAPVRVEANTVSEVATTVTLSCTAMAVTVRLRSVATPRLTTTSSCVFGSNALPVPL